MSNDFGSKWSKTGENWPTFSFLMGKSMVI